MEYLTKAKAAIEEAQNQLRELAKTSIGTDDEMARRSLSRVNELQPHVDALTQQLKKVAEKPAA